MLVSIVFQLLSVAIEKSFHLVIWLLTGSCKGCTVIVVVDSIEPDSVPRGVPGGVLFEIDSKLPIDIQQ